MYDETKEKLLTLRETIREMGRVLIAYSGGMDSTFLAKLSLDCLGKENVLLVTARSPFFPEREIKDAEKTARFLGADHIIIEHNELEVEAIVENSLERCYHCKRELFEKLLKMATKFKKEYVLDGTTKDDEGDFRPGIRALRELGIRSPLSECGLTKREIKALSEEMNLPTQNKPSFACLASRFPYGQRITEEKLRMVNTAEELLLEMGFRVVRVRHYGELARIEVGEDEINRFMSSELRKKVVESLKGLGYVYVTLDLRGFRSGSMNEAIKYGGGNGRVR
ncbi:MAG: ATP-dependent sacrificial sulfur transferase LarE [Desulfobacterota bacterium]|nr:ATP-dependent sacrificial sulfur transferase LarE [Thermodesulfobacteriota bacterium]MDW8001536.1 ATP-dependent sacrificial sulfur transferase LarE [Deltaproteobacteria bacterium]